jgi:hypothetical protein
MASGFQTSITIEAGLNTVALGHLSLNFCTIVMVPLQIEYLPYVTGPVEMNLRRWVVAYSSTKTILLAPILSGRSPRSIVGCALATQFNRGGDLARRCTGDVRRPGVG